MITNKNFTITQEDASEELKEQSRKILDGEEHSNNVYPVQIAFNTLPLAGDILENNYSEEEIIFLWNAFTQQEIDYLEEGKY